MALTVGREPRRPETIAAYLRELGAALHGPRDWRRRVLVETEDGLRSELDALDGVTERDVVRGWGRVADIATEFNRSGRALWARRMARAILQWTPILIIGWGLVVQLSPDPWRAEPVLVAWIVPLLFAATTAAVAGAVQLARGAADSVLSGRDMRGIACACIGVGVAVLCLLILFWYRLIASHWHMFWPGSIVSGTLTVMLLAVVTFHAWHLVPMRPARSA